MNIDRKVDQGGWVVAENRVKFVLDQLEKNGFKKEFGWKTEIARHLTLEEIIGALVSSEQTLNELYDK